MGGGHSSVLFILLLFFNGEGSFFGLHFLKIAIVGNIGISTLYRTQSVPGQNVGVLNRQPVDLCNTTIVQCLY